MNGHDYSSSGHENEGHKSRSRSRVRVSTDDNAVGLTSVLDQGQFFLVVGQQSNRLQYITVTDLQQSTRGQPQRRRRRY